MLTAEIVVASIVVVAAVFVVLGVWFAVDIARQNIAYRRRDRADIALLDVIANPSGFESP